MHRFKLFIIAKYFPYLILVADKEDIFLLYPSPQFHGSHPTHAAVLLKEVCESSLVAAAIVAHTAGGREGRGEEGEEDQG